MPGMSETAALDSGPMPCKEITELNTAIQKVLHEYSKQVRKGNHVILRFWCMMVCFDSRAGGNVHTASAAALAFSLLRRKLASLGTKQRSEKAVLPAIFRLFLLSISLGDPTNQLLLPSQPTQTGKEAKRKETVWVLCEA